MHTILLGLLLAQSPSTAPEPQKIGIGFIEGAENSKIVVCVRTEAEKLLCVDFEKFTEEMRKRGTPLPFAGEKGIQL